MSRIRYWLAGLGGGRPDVMDDVPGSFARFSALGGVLVATAVVAAISAAYALHMALDMPMPLAVIAGLGWGFLILTLDRALIQTMSQQRGWKANIAMAVPRILIALVLGIVISTPLVLRIFDSEIQNELAVMRLEQIDAHAKLVSDNEQYKRIPGLQEQVDARQKLVDTPPVPDPSTEKTVQDAQQAVQAAQTKIDELQAAVTKPPGVDLTSDSLVQSLQKAYDTALADYNDKHEKAQCELNGTCGTNIAGEGAASEAAKAAETTAKQAMDDAKAKLDAAIADATAAQKGAGSQEREVAENALPEAKAQLAQRQAELKKAQEAAVAAQQAGAQAAHVTAEKELAVLRPELERIQDQKREDERIFQDTLSSSGGLLNRLEALERLGNTHSAMRTAEILLSLLFIFIEILPVVMKVMMNLGTPFTYDKVLATRNEKLKESLEAADNVEVEKAARDAEFALERHEDLIAQERESAHLVNEQVVAVQREVIQQALVLWREKALEQAGAALNRYSADPVRVEDRVVVGPEPEHTVEEEPDSFSPSSPYAQERESRLV